MTDSDRRPWMRVPPDRLIGRGHAAGDFLEAYDWTVVEEREGYLKISAHLPQHVRNPRGQLFGGFTPAYVDLVALFTTRAGAERQSGEIKRWLATTNMRVDYLEPVLGPTVSDRELPHPPPQPDELRRDAVPRRSRARCWCSRSRSCARSRRRRAWGRVRAGC